MTEEQHGPGLAGGPADGHGVPGGAAAAAAAAAAAGAGAGADACQFPVGPGGQSCGRPIERTGAPGAPSRYCDLPGHNRGKAFAARRAFALAAAGGPAGGPRARARARAGTRWRRGCRSGR